MRDIYLHVMNIGVPMIVSFGALQGILMSVILGFAKKYRIKFVQYFALLLLTISVINIYGAFDIIKSAPKPIFEDYIPYFWSNLIPPALYFFITYLIKPNYKFKKWDYLFFLPLLIDFLYQSAHFINFIKTGPYTLEAYYTFDFVGNIFELFAAVFTTIIYLISIKRVNQYNRGLKDKFSDITKTNLYWAKRFLIIGLLITLGWFVVSFLNVSAGYFFKPLALIVWISVSVLIYWTAYSMLHKSQLFKAIQAETEKPNLPSTKTLKPKLSLAEIVTIQQNLENIMVTQKVYLKPNLTLRDLSNAVKVSDKKLSLYFNETLATNFYDYINQQRIQEFKNRLNTEDLNNFSIVGIALQCGFNSKSSFYRIFKKYEHKTPSEYIRRIKSNPSH